MLRYKYEFRSHNWKLEEYTTGRMWKQYTFIDIVIQAVSTQAYQIFLKVSI